MKFMNNLLISLNFRISDNFNSFFYSGSRLTIFSVALLCMPVNQVLADILLDSGWETGKFESYGWSISGNRAVDVVSQSEPLYKQPYILEPTPIPVCGVKNNNKVARFNLNYESVTNPSKSNNYRTQLSLNRGDHKKFQLGKKYWIAFSVFLPENWLAEDILNAEVVVFGMHGRPDRNIGEKYRKGFFNIRIIQDQWIFLTSWSDKKNNFPEGGVESVVRRRVPVGKFKTGVWTNFVIEVNMTWKPEGYVRLYMDDDGNGYTQVAERLNGIGYNDALGPYAKIGIYKVKWKSDGCSWCGPTKVPTRTLYIDNFRIGNGSSSLKQIGAAMCGNGQTIPLPEVPTGLSL